MMLDTPITKKRKPSGLIFKPGQKIVEKWNEHTRSHYEKLGYTFTESGDTFIVPAADLTPGSGKRVIVICPVCKSERSTQRCTLKRSGTSLCRGCSIIVWKIGKRMERLTVVGFLGTKNNSSYWLCECDCGNIKQYTGSEISQSDRVKSCGCLAVDHARKMGRGNRADITGNKYGKLTAVKFLYSDDYNQAVWLCRCECGESATAGVGQLNIGGKKSCGCDIYKYGEDHWNWNPDLADADREGRKYEDGYREFLQSVLSRDGYTCVGCGASSKIATLNVHHMYSYTAHPQYRTSREHCVTLCEECHADFHLNYMGSYREICTPKDFYGWLQKIKRPNPGG